MSVKRKILLIVLFILLTGGIILCTVRWQVWFGNPEEPVWQADTVCYSFHTFGEQSLDKFVKFEDRHSAVWQDIHQPDTLAFILLGDVHNQIDSLSWVKMAERHTDIDFYAQVGDLFERGYYFYYQQLASELEGTPFQQLPLVNTPGNHEYRKGIVRRLPQLWYDLFPQPLNGPERFLGTTYYIDFPDLRLIVIDTNGLQRMSDYTIVNTWTRQTLRSAGDRFTIVLMHHPVFSASQGRQNPLIYLTFRRVLQDADLVFAGHDHNYARRLPFIVTNSAQKYYLNKINPKDTRICSGHQLYQYITLIRHTPPHTQPSTLFDTLNVETRFLSSGELYDLVKVVHTPDTTAGNCIDRDLLVTSYIEPMNNEREVIDLPDKYKTKNSRKVRRFLQKRSERLSERTAQQNSIDSAQFGIR
ncbi:MAG: metallophosphoesterase [Paludibacteraceae bacterium]|nr:metallophosphoesterase [Paludibacteraceae bacterium]